LTSSGSSPKSGEDGSGNEDAEIEGEIRPQTPPAQPSPSNLPSASSPTPSVASKGKGKGKHVDVDIPDTATSTGTSSKRSRPGTNEMNISSTALTSSSLGKTRPKTGAVSLGLMNDRLDVFNTAYNVSSQSKARFFDSMTARVERGAVRDDDVKRDAQQKLEAIEQGLSFEEKLAIIDMFNSDVVSARTYITFASDAFRKFWARKQLKNMGFSIRDEDMDTAL
jgi:hypothetical protein